MPKANDGIDAEQLRLSAMVVQDAKSSLLHLRSARAHIDMDTAEKVERDAHAAISKLHETLSLLAAIKSTRRKQATSLVDGKRSKA